MVSGPHLYLFNHSMKIAEENAITRI